MTRNTFMHVDPSGIEHNLNRVKQLAPHSHITAMVKANAYGCGLNKVIPIFCGQVEALGVACINEAVVIRQLGYDMPIILFQGTFSAEEYSLIDQYRFELVIHSEHQLQQFLHYKFAKPIQCWLKVDTGMHRLGIALEDVENAVKRLKDSANVTKPIGIMSHFACADVPGHALNTYQRTQFDTIHSMLGSDFIYSLSNSAAIISQPSAHYDMVRPGIMLYGGSPIKNKMAAELGLKPVTSFYSQIMSIKKISAGESVGYGAIWAAKRQSKIAVVAAGYGDGYPRHISPEAYVAVDNQTAPIVGRISMDMLVIDVTELSRISIGDKVELWGAQVPIDQVANWAGTISYELLCQFQQRVEPFKK